MRRLIIALFIIVALAASIAGQPPNSAQARGHKGPGPSPTPSESPTPTPAERIATLQQKLKDNPNDKESRAELGALLIQTGKARDGRDQVEQAIKQGIDDARVWYYVGQADIILSDPADAALAFEKAEIRDPANSAILGSLVDAYLSLNRVDDAYRIAKRSVELNPKDASSYESLGTVQLDQNKLDEGRKTLQQALAVDPTDLRAKLLIARSYLAGSKPDPDTALTQINALLATDPNNVDALRAKAQALAAKNDVAGAVAALQAVITLQPDRVDAELAVAELYLDKKMIPQARQAFSQAQKDHPSSTLPWMLEAEYDADQKNWTQAAQEYQAELAISGSDPQALFEYGRVQLSGLNQPAAAQATFQKLLSAHPDDAEAVFWLGQSYAAGEKWAQARDQFKRAFGLTHSYQALFNLGIAYFNLKDYRNARGVFEALAFAPGSKQHPNPQLWYVLGETDRKMGDKRSAIYAYRQFLAIQPSGQAASRARSYIKALGG